MEPPWDVMYQLSKASWAIYYCGINCPEMVLIKLFQNVIFHVGKSGLAHCPIISDIIQCCHNILHHVDYFGVKPIMS